MMLLPFRGAGDDVERSFSAAALRGVCLTLTGPDRSLLLLLLLLLLFFSPSEPPFEESERRHRRIARGY
jgi:hypothetical protein